MPRRLVSGTTIPIIAAVFQTVVVVMTVVAAWYVVDRVNIQSTVVSSAYDKVAMIRDSLLHQYEFRAEFRSYLLTGAKHDIAMMSLAEDQMLVMLGRLRMMYDQSELMYPGSNINEYGRDIALHSTMAHNAVDRYESGNRDGSLEPLRDGSMERLSSTVSRRAMLMLSEEQVTLDNRKRQYSSMVNDLHILAPLIGCIGVLASLLSNTFVYVLLLKQSNRVGDGE